MTVVVIVAFYCPILGLLAKKGRGDGADTLDVDTDIVCTTLEIITHAVKFYQRFRGRMRCGTGTMFIYDIHPQIFLHNVSIKAFLIFSNPVFM